MPMTCKKCGQITDGVTEANVRICNNGGPNHGRKFAYCVNCNGFLLFVDGQPSHHNKSEYRQPDNAIVLHKLARLEEQLSLLMEKVTQIEHNTRPKGGLFGSGASTNFVKNPIFTKTNQEHPEVEVFTSTPATTKPPLSPFM